MFHAVRDADDALFKHSMRKERKESNSEERDVGGRKKMMRERKDENAVETKWTHVGENCDQISCEQNRYFSIIFCVVFLTKF